MYFVRKIRKTKKSTRRSSFIVSLPKKLQQKLETHNDEISKRLANFTRFRYFYDDMEDSRCFLLSLWSSELPPNSIHDRTKTTTIQNSGKTSRYVIIPKKVCYKYGWDTGIELVIGLDYNIDEYVQGTIYKDDDFVPVEGKQPEACVIKFQRYQDMKKLYQKRLAKKKEDLARQESDAYWSTRNRPSYYDLIMERIRYEKKYIHKLVWSRLFQMNLVAVSYNDFVKLRAVMEREKKKKKKQFLQKRYGRRATWRYRRDLVRYGKRFGYDYDAQRENMLDDPDTYRENMLDDPETYGNNIIDNLGICHEDELDDPDD